MILTGRFSDEQGAWDLIKCQFCGHDDHIGARSSSIHKLVCPVCDKSTVSESKGGE